MVPLLGVWLRWAMTAGDERLYKQRRMEPEKVTAAPRGRLVRV